MTREEQFEIIEKAMNDASTEIEKVEPPRDIHLVTPYICKKCQAVWAGPITFCPGCGRKNKEENK